MPRLLKASLRAAAKRDDASRFELLTALGRTFFPRYRFKWPQMAWWDDHEFNAYLGRVGELHGNNTDRKWALGQLLRLVTHVPGDTAECGVYLAEGSTPAGHLQEHPRRGGRWRSRRTGSLVVGAARPLLMLDGMTTVLVYTSSPKS